MCSLIFENTWNLEATLWRHKDDVTLSVKLGKVLHRLLEAVPNTFRNYSPSPDPGSRPGPSHLYLYLASGELWNYYKPM